jgi:hypothetical protein
MALDLKAKITLANERELTANENAIAQCFPPPAVLSEEAKMAVVPFLTWCEVQRVRALPARPASVAAFICLLKDQNVPRQIVVESLRAIEALHIAAAVANPVATPIVSATLGTTVEPPRSWARADKEFFKTLPLHAQEIIADREQERETHLRRTQNALAEQRRQLKTAADPKPVNINEKEIEMATKKDKGAGPYSNPTGEDPIYRREGHLPSQDRGKDISRRVDANNSNDGFSGPLKPKGE